MGSQDPRGIPAPGHGSNGAVRSRTLLGTTAVCLLLPFFACAPKQEAPSSAYGALGTPDLACLMSTLDPALREVTGSEAVPGGAAAVFDRDQILFAVSGRTTSGGSEITRSTGFHFGSTGKAVTATLAGHLAELGLLSFTDSIGSMFGPEVLRPWRGVTLEQLLTHRAGLPPFTDDSAWSVFQRYSEFRMPEARRRFGADVLAAPPLYPPGTDQQYSNASFILAAAMMEAATGEAFESLIQRHILRGLEIEGGFDDPGESVANFALGHTRSGTGGSTREDLPHTPLVRPAGDMWFRFDDYAHFAAAHLRALLGEPGVLDPKTVRYLHTPIGQYAKGWGIQEYQGTELHLHVGGAGTSYALVALYPEMGWGTTIAVNVGGGDTESEVLDLFRTVSSAVHSCGRSGS